MSKSTDEDTIGLVVHSYNNFLAGMMGFTELSLLEVEQDDLKERLELVLSSGKEAVVFGKQLLSLTSRLQVAMKPVEVMAIIKEITNADNIELVKEFEDQSVTVKSDAQWLWYCLETLCQFCKKLSQSDSMAMTVKLDGDQLIIELNDKALELSQEQSEKIFEPFYSSRHMFGTKDVGLGFIRGFISQMKGEMIWDDERGFVMTLNCVVE